SSVLLGRWVQPFQGTPRRPPGTGQNRLCAKDLGPPGGRAAPRAGWHDVPMTERLTVDAWLTDMDGVLVHEEQALHVAAEFIAARQEHWLRFQLLTNDSIFTPRDLRARLAAGGIEVPEEAIWTSALATAQLLADQ